jgi:glycerol-3-phosphate acyltransferase PlsY
LDILLWTTLGFLLGSIPFSYLLARLFGHVDLRTVDDGNPGAVNAWRAAGGRVGLPACLLDFLKAAVPVGLAGWVFGVSGWGLLPIALAPIVGHAFSPFLGFRGGKAVSTTFGTWSGLTLWEVPMVFGGFLGLFVLLQTADAWSVLLAMFCLLAYLVAQDSEGVLLVIWVANLLVIVWKHRKPLRETMELRPYVTSLLRIRR